MNIEEIRDYCLSKPGVTEGFPFDETTLVFKVMNKMFALVGLERVPPFINLKCNPERAIELREQHEDIQPGWHMNKIIICFRYTVNEREGTFCHLSSKAGYVGEVRLIYEWEEGLLWLTSHR